MEPLTSPHAQSTPSGFVHNPRAENAKFAGPSDRRGYFLSGSGKHPSITGPCDRLNRSLLSVFTTRMCKTASAKGLPKSKWVCQKPSLCWTCCLAHQKEFSHSLLMQLFCLMLVHVHPITLLPYMIKGIHGKGSVDTNFVNISTFEITKRNRTVMFRGRLC